MRRRASGVLAGLPGSLLAHVAAVARTEVARAAGTYPRLLMCLARGRPQLGLMPGGDSGTAGSARNPRALLGCPRDYHHESTGTRPPAWSSQARCRSSGPASRCSGIVAPLQSRSPNVLTMGRISDRMGEIRSWCIYRDAHRMLTYNALLWPMILPTKPPPAVSDCFLQPTYPAPTSPQSD